MDPGSGPVNAAASRPKRRSRKGCAECKLRRIKCDEKRPQCGKCAQHGRACTILDSLFRTDARSSAATSNTSRQLATPAVVEPTPIEQPVTAPWEITDSFALPELDHVIQDQTVSTQLDGNPRPASSATQAVSPAHSVTPDISMRVSHPSRMTATPTFVNHVSPGQASTTSEPSQNDEEIAFFSRIFNEGAAQWLDLLNDSRCFTQWLPVLSRQNSLVQYAACAVAAKQLGQAADFQAQIRRTNGQRLAALALVRSDRVFNWYGAKYYEKAIQLLTRQLSHGSPNWPSHPSPSILYDLDPGTGHESPTTALMVTCMLSLYEMLSATVSMSAWGGHLNRLYKLLQNTGNGELFNPQSTVLAFSPDEVIAMQASFWWFVLSDIEQSFATLTRTRVEMSNLALRRHMGLPLDDNGRLDESIYTHYSTAAMVDSTISRAIIRAVGGMVNSFASTSRNSARPREETEKQIDAARGYLTALPSLPLANYHWNPGPPETTLTHELFGQETWYTNPLNAVAAALHHMAQILLLVNAPISANIQTQQELLRASHTLQAGLRDHAASIFAIALGKPEESVQAHLSQPLFVAGQCLTEKADRVFLINMIRTRENDLGIMGEYRVSDLITEWGTSYEELGLHRKEVLRRKDFWG